MRHQGTLSSKLTLNQNDSSQRNAILSAQTTDSIVINNETYSLYSTPLILWHGFEKFSDALPCGHSGNKRGYTADWTISNKKLYMIGIDTFHPESEKPTVYDLFGESPAFAVWFSGELSILIEGIDEYCWTGDDSTQKWLIIDVRSGRVSSQNEKQINLKNKYK